MKGYLCDECQARIPVGTELSGRSPFSGQEIIGCPECLEINTLYSVCDAPECWGYVAAGTQTPEGYKSLCSVHYQKHLREQRLLES